MNRVMRHLGMLEGSKPEPMPTKVLKEFPWVRSEHDGFLYRDVKVGDKVEKGQVLGKVTDFEGNVLQTAVAPASGEVLFTVSSLAINNGDPLLAVGA
jgi:predicted deacylase